MPFMPESPVYLVMKGSHDEAHKALVQLRGKAYDSDSELNDISLAIEEQKRIGSISPKELFTEGIYLKPFTIMLFLMGLMQFCGANAVTFNLERIFDAGNTSMDAGLAATFVGIDQVRKLF